MAKKKITTQMFKDEVYRLVGEEYIVLGEYIKAKVKIKMLHQVCNKSFEMAPDNFKNGQRCPHCFGNKKKTTEQFKEEVFKVVGDEYVVVGEYKTTHSKIKMLHRKCGKEFEIVAKSFVNEGRRCPHCREKQKQMGRRYAKTTEEFKKEVYNLVGNEYEVIGEYTTCKDHIEIKHNECGKTYKVSPSNFLRGKRCPYCNFSKGESVIRQWLDKNNIEYISQYKFDDCRYKKPLPFDFAVFNEGQLKMLIEFDGFQHYEPVNGWGGKRKLEETKIKDSIKNKYCEDNDIKLIRIPYWDIDKIENILEREME